MNLQQLDATALSNLKCSFSTLHSKKLQEEEYLINLCNKSILDNVPFKEYSEEKYLKIFLIENIGFINRTNEYGKEIITCDLNKIYIS